MKLTVKTSFKKVLVKSFISIFVLGGCFTACSPNAAAKDPYSYVSVDDSDFENMEALQFTKIMGNGINLGNTMEAAGASWLGFNATPDKYEAAWGQPKTTKEIFQGYKAAGIDSVRIPVAWMSTMDIANGDYTINQDFINYVKNIVNMALESDLIVIINDHWDYGWWSYFGHEDKKEEAYKIMDAIWDTVGTTFKDYSYKLVFEAGNEEWGEGFFHEFKIGNNTFCENIAPNTWGISEAEKQAFYQKGYDLIEEVGQYFVDKIRAQGSNNTKRFLLIPGFNTGFEPTVDYDSKTKQYKNRYKMPSDPSNTVNKLLVSVHYYAPSQYSILEEDASWGKVADSWGTPEEVNEQNFQFSLMSYFTEKGYGVIIGEYGVARLCTNPDRKKDAYGNDLEKKQLKRKNNDVDWITNILDNCDKYNYAPMLWDCNGYFSKGVDEDGKPRPIGFVDEDIAAIYKNRNYASEKPADIADKKLSVSTAESGIAEYSINIPFKAGDQIKISASFSGASNFKQIGLQTSADSDWHQAWEDGGFTDNYVYTETITANSDGNTIQFKYIIQQPINPDSSPSEITISKVKVTVNK